MQTTMQSGSSRGIYSASASLLLMRGKRLKSRSGINSVLRFDSMLSPVVGLHDSGLGLNPRASASICGSSKL